MNKEHAIKTFVRKNYHLLSEKEHFDKKEYKIIKDAYFRKEIRLKFGIPHDKEICKHLIEFIIKYQKISNKDELDILISQTPFLRLQHMIADDYQGLIHLTAETYALKEDIQEVEDIEQLEKQLEYVKRKNAKELDEAIQQKEKEYRRLPSILDDTDFIEPQRMPEEEEKKEWWEVLNLYDNPFFGPLDGFSQIDQSLYNEIIVETQPINWALKEIEKEQLSIFHRGYLLAGEFGTGKTTFYDFIAPYLTLKRIEPIRIALSEHINEAHYYQDFEKKLCNEIYKTSKKFGILPTSQIIDFEEAVLLMLSIQDIGTKGFFIFIDDLHKHIDVERVFNYLANLQITKNNLTREGVNVAFFVAGFPAWRTKIRRESALTGFFDAADELTLPEVTPEMAAKAIQKRLHAYSRNPDKELAVKGEFLNTIFKRVSNDIGQSNIGFRPYIQEAIKNFSERKFDILSMGYRKLDDSTANNIKIILEANTQFKESIDRLIFGGRIKEREAREQALRLLCQVYLSNGISEDMQVFINNTFYFKGLREVGLIQKYDRDGNLVWKISQFLNKLNKEILLKFNLSVEDYLVPIYSTPTTKTVRRRVVPKRETEYRRDLKEWKGMIDKPIEQSLGIVLKLYADNIAKHTNYIRKEIEPEVWDQLFNIDKVNECIWTTMKCIMQFESPALQYFYKESDFKGWTLRHRSLEYCRSFMSLEQDMGKRQLQSEDYSRFISVANDAFNELWNELRESLVIYQRSMVKCYALPLDVLRNIYTVHRYLFMPAQPREEYFEYLDRFTSQIEESIRKYLLSVCTLLFGNYPHERMVHYPKEINKYMSQNMAGSSKAFESFNEFEELNRGQYRYLFTQIGRNTTFARFVIEPIIKKWDSKDLNSFFEIFGEVNIKTSHSKRMSVEEIKKEVPTYFRLACRLVADMSARVVNLLRDDNTILRNNNQIFIVFGYVHWKNKERHRTIDIEAGNVIPSELFKYDITSAINDNRIDDITEISDNLFGTCELNLLNIEETQIKLGMLYCISLGVIANAWITDKIVMIPSYGPHVHLLKRE